MDFKQVSTSNSMNSYFREGRFIRIEISQFFFREQLTNSSILCQCFTKQSNILFSSSQFVRSQMALSQCSYQVFIEVIIFYFDILFQSSSRFNLVNVLHRFCQLCSKGLELLAIQSKTYLAPIFQPDIHLHISIQSFLKYIRSQHAFNCDHCPHEQILLILTISIIADILVLHLIILQLEQQLIIVQSCAEIEARQNLHFHEIMYLGERWLKVLCQQLRQLPSRFCAQVGEEARKFGGKDEYRSRF